MDTLIYCFTAVMAHGAGFWPILGKDEAAWELALPTAPFCFQFSFGVRGRSPRTGRIRRMRPASRAHAFSGAKVGKKLTRTPHTQ
jgi:hypothetical protein